MSLNTSLNLSDRMSLDFEDMADSLPDASSPFLSGWTWACDTKGRYISCSPEVGEILGIDAQAFKGQNLASFALSVKSAELLEVALNKGIFPIEVRLNYQRSNGTSVPAAIHILPTHAPSGEQSGIHGFTITLFPEDGNLPQEEKPVPEQEIPSQKPEPKSQNHDVASAMILDLLDDLQESSAIIAEHPKSSVTVNELSGPAQSDFSAGNGHYSAADDHVIEIEHKLKWGKKFDFDYDEDLFIRRSKFAGPGLRGYLERLSAPQKILKCDLRWLAVILRSDDDGAYVWVDYAQAGENPLKVELSEFLENPNLLKTKIEQALDKPWESIITYRLGVDYLVNVN